MKKHRPGIIALSMLAVLMLLSVGAAYGPALASEWRAAVDPWVLEKAEEEGVVEFIVFLSEQADLTQSDMFKTKLEKGTFVYETLSSLASRTQADLIASLKSIGVEYRSYWAANMIWVRGGLGAVEIMARNPKVARIYGNPAVQLEPPLNESPDNRELMAIEPNLVQVNADDVWALGRKGQGVVIGGQDTGYDWDHPALLNQYRGWNGDSVDHNYSWHDAIHSGGGTCGPDSSEPCDDHGHGTHTMGIMVGDDGAGNQIGMAPEARWIGCRNMNVGVGTPATYAECYQWFIAPTDLSGQNEDPGKAPDVINNSWSCPTSEGCTEPDVLLAVVDAVRAAGILTVHSAGNSGSSCSSVTTPAAIYDSSYTIAAVNSSDTIASFSSRGPVTVDGSGRLKPDISAPGVNIRSSLNGGGYGYKSGTSMAAPHVAGQVALMLSADPTLSGQVDALETIMNLTAVDLTSNQDCVIPGSQVPNNTYGYGRIDALSAVTWILQSEAHWLPFVSTP